MLPAAHWRTTNDRLDSQLGKLRRAEVSIRIASAALALLLPALPAAAQSDGANPQASTGTLHLAAAAARKPAPTTPAPADQAVLPLADRIALQYDLAWSGNYNGLVTGELNERTTAAIKAFQRGRKLRPTGVLTAQERALLADAAKAKQAQVGWTMVDDPVTGARIGLPTKQVPNQGQSQTGTRWSSAQGQVQIETFKIREPGTTLAAVYEQQKKEPPTRKLEVSLLRPDFFILSGTQNLKRFYVRGEIKDGEVRGMTVLYDQATETIMDPVVVVMSSAFTPFPAISGTTQIAPPPKRKVEYGTGIVVSTAGHILTDRQLIDGCNVVVIGGYGDAEPQAEDNSADLALVQVHGAPDLMPAAFASDGGSGPNLTLIGIADPQSQGGGSAISTKAAKLDGGSLVPAPQAGFSGGGALDPQGRFVGMVALKMPVTANAAANAPPQAALVPAATIRAFLEEQKLAPAAAGRSGPEAAKASVVRVICVRK